MQYHAFSLIMFAFLAVSPVTECTSVVIIIYYNDMHACTDKINNL